jgi:hypothetical protein
MAAFQKSTAMSVQRIVISLLIFFLVPVIRHFLGGWIENDTLGLMFALNFCVWLLITYDWELFGLHWLRCKENPGDTLLYTFVGAAVLFLWTWFNSRFLHGVIVMPDVETIRSYFIAMPAILIAFSFSLSALVNICFKCLTDHFKIHAREATIILLSGFLFGFIYTVCFCPLQLSIFVPTYLYNVILICVLSYLYNQTHSFIPGILAMGIVYLIWQLLLLVH